MSQIKKKFIDGAVFTEIQGNINTGVQSAKDYADSQDLLKLQEAKAYADQVKSDLLNGAGPALDTLKELGDLLTSDGNAIAALTTSIGVVDGKVDQEILDRAVAVQGAKDYADAQIALIPAFDAGSLQAADAAMAGRLDVLEPKVSTLEGQMVGKAEQTYVDSQDAAKLVEAKAYTDAQIAAIPPVDLSAKADISYVDSQDAAKLVQAKSYADIQDAAKLVEAKAYTDAQIAAIPPVDLSGVVKKDGSNGAMLAALNMGGFKIENVADGEASANAVNKGQLDATLVSAKSYTDTKIAAIPAFDASALQDADVALDGRLDIVEPKVTTLEGKVATLEGLVFVKEKIVIGATLTHVELANEAKPNSCIVFVDRLALHQDEDFTVSVVGGKTRLTWAGEFMVGGTEAVETGYPIYITYYK